MVAMGTSIYMDSEMSPWGRRIPPPPRVNMVHIRIKNSTDVTSALIIDEYGTKEVVHQRMQTQQSAIFLFVLDCSSLCIYCCADRSISCGGMC